MAPQQVLDRMQSMAPMRPTETMAQQALGGQTGGTYLAPALYRPVVQVWASPLLPCPPSLWCCLTLSDGRILTNAHEDYQVYGDVQWVWNQ